MTTLETSLIGIEDAGTENTCIKSADVGDISSTRSAYVKNAFFGDAYAQSTYVKDANTVKHLGINLQSFQISEIELFGT